MNMPQPLTQRSRPVKARIMRGITVLILVAGLVLTIAAILVIRTFNTNDIEFLQQITLSEVEGRFRDLLDPTIADLTQIAASPSAQSFAVETVSLSGLDTDLQNAQGGLISQLTTLVESGRGTYLGAKYIMRTGSIWTEVTWDDGIINVNDQFALRVLDPNTNPMLSSGLNTEFGAVTLADFEVREQPNGDIIPVIRLVTPITRPNDLNSILGVIELEMDATRLLGIANAVSVEIAETGTQERVMIVANNRVIADSDQTSLNYLIADNAYDFSDTLFQYLADNPGTIENQRINAFNLDQLVVARPIQSLSITTGGGWRVVVITNASEVFASAVQASILIAIFNFLGVALTIWYVNRSLERNLRPLSTVNALMQSLIEDRGGAGETVERTRSTQEINTAVTKTAVQGETDEDTQIYRAAQQLAQQLETLNAQLDQQSERYNRNLKVVARISRETALLENIDALLNREIDLIATSFGLYHVQVFLVDDAGINAVLRYSRGEAGRRLIERGHKLPIGSKSVIGRVTATRQPVIVNDTQSGAAGDTHAFNPILSETRSEMALPLQIGDEILGALDLQSDKVNAFQEDELQTYQLIADQISIAIYKTRLLQQSEDRISEIEMLNKQLTQMAWEELEHEIGLERAYRYNLLEVEAGDLDNSSIYATSQMMSLPITIRGEVIGTITAAPPEGMDFTGGDESILRSVAERVALAVENARLFQETQNNLAETATLYQTSRYLNEATEIKDIIAAIIQSAMPSAQTGLIVVFEEYQASAGPEWIMINGAWTAASDSMIQTAVNDLPGTRLYAPDYPILGQLNSNKVTLINDTENDNRLNTELREFFKAITAYAVVFIPLTVRGMLRGAAIITFPASRTFSEREGRIYNNIIDQAGVAIENRLLLRQTEQALNQNERLYAGSRMINQAQGLNDLVRAAVITTNQQALNFGLALFEGELDATGWSRSLRHVAQSRNGGIYEPDRIYDIRIDETSPLREREPITLSGDKAVTEMEQTLFNLLRSNGDRYGTIFPLFSTNQPIALFSVSRKDDQRLTDEDYEIYRALTGQMSTVIQNSRLLEQTAAALDETRRLYEANRSITNAADMEAMYEAVTRHLTLPLRHISRINIVLADPNPTPEAPYLNVRYSWIPEDSLAEPMPINTRIESKALPFGQLMLDREITLAHIKDIDTELHSYPKIQTFFKESGVREAIVAPLVSRQQWLGVIILESQINNAYNTQYTRFVDAVADQIAIALENQVLFEEAQQEARQALALAEASQLASQMRGELTDVIGTLFNRVAETAGYDRWLLMLLEGNTLELITQQTPKGVPGIVRENLNLDTADHAIADTIRYNRTLIINDPENYPAYHDDLKLIRAVGKHIATPIISGETVIGGLIIGRQLSEADMTGRDETLISTLAAQVAVTVENRRLFLTAENERGTLRSILETLPAGVLVLDAKTLVPIQANNQVTEYLGRGVDMNNPFAANSYDLYRTGTNLNYPNHELPIVIAAQQGKPSFADDISVITDAGHLSDLLINAAPIRDSAGTVTSIVAAFEDISNLRNLENTLQDNLRETISLYEATRTLAEADELDEVLDVILFQLIMMEPENAHVVLLDNEGIHKEVARSMTMPVTIDDLPETILSHERQLLINDVNSSSIITDSNRQTLAQAGIGAVASFPLLASKREMPLGWMLITHSSPYEFTPEEERFLNTLADNAAVAIDNRYLFESTQRALRETSFLYNATTQISRTRDLDTLAEVIRSALASLAPDVFAAYLMTNPSSPDQSIELFNDNLDGAPLDFQSLLAPYGLFRDENIYIENLNTLENPTPFEQALQEMQVIGAFASVTLRIKGEPDGRLFIGYHSPRNFSEGDVRYLNAIADSASVVVDNAILLDQIQAALNETSTLYQASRELGDATSPEEILNVVVDRLIGIHVNQVFVALLTSRAWDSPAATVEIVANWQAEEGIDLQGISLTSEQFPAWSQLATSSVITISDVETDSRLTELERMGIQSLDTRSLAIIPLRVPTRSIGAVWIASQEAHPYTETEQRIFQAFAEQASLSLEASFLLEQTERRARQLATSAEVSQIAGSILALEELMPRVVNLIRDQFGYDHVQIFLMDDENRFAMLRASTGEAGEQLLAVGHKLERGSQSVIGQVVEQAQPIIALDTSDARVVHRPNPFLPLTRSEMALPIKVKGKVIGALDVQSNQSNAFDDDDVSVLTTLAAQLAVAIDNARLFDEAESRADEMSFLFTITTAAASANTLDEALDNVVEMVHNSLRTLSVGIYLLEQDEKTGNEVMRIVSMWGSEQPLSEVEDVIVGDRNNLVGVVADNLTPMIIDDIRQEPRYLPLAAEAKSAIIVPQGTGNEVVGLIVMESERVGRFDQDSLTLLLTLSGTLAAIVQNARLLEQILQANEDLKTLDRIKSDFLANMSHELRTPLNSIIGFSRVMLKGIDGPLTETQEQDLTTIYNSGQHLLGLINDILDSAKIAADKMDLEKEFFDIRAVIEGARSIGIGLLKEKTVDIYAEIANNLPEAYGDEFRTRQVLLNLVSNAAKFTEEGNVTIRAYTVEGENNIPMIQIDVVDTGIGIEEKDLPALFEAFRQVDSSLTRSKEGTGLGLPIAKSLVELQGGEMTVNSIYRQGSTFTFTVPTQAVEVIMDEDGNVVETVLANAIETDDLTTPPATNGSSSPEKPKKLAEGPPPGIFQQKRQILIIEDNPDMVDQFRRQLQREGFEVQVANHPMFAETMASGLRPTLIIMDVNFAEGAGWNILQKIKDRDDTFDIPVIVVTMSNESERAFTLGAYDFIQRPYMPDDLLNSVLKAEQESNIDRILIIDDQKDSTRLIEELLQEHGKYRVFAAHTGLDGISLVARRRPDLIILDLRMPGMDGFAVLNELRQNPETASIPVVVVTGETTLSDSERDQLVNLEIIYKTDLNQQNYQYFIDEVERQIAKYHGK